MVWLFQSHTLQLCLTKSQLGNNTRGISDVSVTCKPYGSPVEISSPVNSSVTLRDPELTEWSHMCYCSPQCTAGRTLILISNVFCMGDWNFCLSLLVPRKSLFLLCWDDMEYWPTRRDSRTTLWNHFSFPLLCWFERSNLESQGFIPRTWLAEPSCYSPMLFLLLRKEPRLQIYVFQSYLRDSRACSQTSDFLFIKHIKLNIPNFH